MGYSGYLLITAGQARWGHPLATLAHLHFLSGWFFAEVVTDGFAACDKICRCVANCRFQLRHFSQVGCSEQLSGGSSYVSRSMSPFIFSKVQVPPVTLLEAAACCHQLHSWNS